MSRINSVGVIGAGTMGSALAQKFAQEGMTVVMVDTEDRFLEKGLGSIKATLDEGVNRKIFSEEQVREIQKRISTTTDLENLANCQLIVEAVFEDRKVKEDLFAQISAIVPSDTILATNTSSFSVTDLSSSVSLPERFLGLHFFYHAAKNRLVEVVKGGKTDENTFSEVLRFMQRCGKDPITCKDAHGFVVNRFFVPWLNEAVRLYEEDVAEPTVIDAIACQTFGCGMGPFALMNATGIPIAYHTQKTLEQAYGEFYRPAKALAEQMNVGKPWSISDGKQANEAQSQIISERFLGVVFLVCGQLLDEKICTAGDINRGARIGLRWRKGPIEIYHKYGEKTIQKLANTMADNWNLTAPESLSPNDWQPDFITTDKSANVGTITINRPEGLNAMNPLVISQLAKAFDDLNSDDTIDTILLTGRGKAFVAGADIKFFINHIQNNSINEIVSFTTEGHNLFLRIDDSPKKVVAAVNGLALGGGLELALTADIIIALNKAVFAFPETGIGIYPGLGGTQRTVDRIGKGLTKYLIYTGQMIDADTAEEIGLIDKAVSWDELDKAIKNPSNLQRSSLELSDKWRRIESFFNEHTVSELLENDFPEEWSSIIKKIRRKAPLALRLAEKLINAHKGPLSELECIEEVFKTDDALAGMKSVGGKPPVFQGS